jgi:hypothetical protein
MSKLKDQYNYLWWWMLEQGIFISAVLVNLFSASIFAIAMAILHIFVKWYDKFR